MELENIESKEVQERIKLAMLSDAKNKPWSYSWKYLNARHMLMQGRNIKFVKDTIGVTYQWMIRTSLIQLSNGRYVSLV